MTFLFPFRHFFFLLIILICLISACIKFDKDVLDNQKYFEKYLTYTSVNNNMGKNNLNGLSKSQKIDNDESAYRKFWLVPEKYSIINSDYTKAHIKSDSDSTIKAYFYKGNVVKIEEISNHKGIYNNIEDYFYYIRGGGGGNGWVHGSRINSIEVIQGNETTLTNSIMVNHENFPETKNSFMHIGLESSPDFLMDTKPWVILETSAMNIYSLYGLSIHLPNLEDTYEIHIYDNDSNLFKKYITDKNEGEANLEDYRDFYYKREKEFEEIKEILPFYIFYFPAWVSHSKQIFKTEIRSINNKVLFSTSIEYPAIPFIADHVYKGCYYLQYSGDNPVYIVLYEEFNDYERFGDGYPVKAFSITPINGYWEGKLNIVTDKPNEGLEIFLYKMDPDNTDDYSKRVEGYWPYRNIFPGR